MNPPPSFELTGNGRKKSYQKLCAPDGFLGLLDEHLLLIILEKLQDCGDRQAWCLACKRLLALEASRRKKIKLLRAEVLENVLRRYTEVEELDLSVCSQVDDDTLETVGRLSGPYLRTLSLARSGRFSEVGLFSLVKLCPKLQHLDLSYSSHIADRGMIAVAQLTKLESLKLVNCRNITDAGLGCVAAGCKNLRSLSLMWCLGVSDTGISLVSANCKQLETLDLSYTEVSSVGLASITYLRRLTNLYLVSCNSVDDTGLAFLQNNRKSLLMLDVARCKSVSNRGVMALATGPVSLQQLCLSHCPRITDSLLASFEKFQSLQVLRLDGCHNAASGLGFIGQYCKALREFSVSKCMGVTDAGICAVAKGCCDLQDLDLTCCQDLTDLAVTSIAAFCKNLRSLKLEACSLISEKGFALLGNNCTALEVLDFTSCNINDEGLKSFTRCTALRTLKLGYCLNITDKGILYIAASCCNLREMDLYRSVGVGDAAVAALANGCPTLQSINLSYCLRITDAGLHEISKLRDLSQLEIRACLLVTSAGLVSVAAGCRRLVELDIKRCTAIDDIGLLAIAHGCPNLRKVNISYCRITNSGLMAVARLSCMQDMKLIHLKGVSLEGLAEALSNSATLKKVKLLSSLRMLLPGLTTQAAESRGCRLRWMENHCFDKSLCESRLSSFRSSFSSSQPDVRQRKGEI